MPRIDPLPMEALEEHKEHLQIIEQASGYVPNSMRTMARVPGLLEAFYTMVATVLRNSVLSRELTQMISLMASKTAGCRYCQAHTAYGATRLGMAEEKVVDIWSFETSEHFDEAERAALRLAVAGAAVPNAATDELFDAARVYYSEDELAAIVAVISMFGYLNRWNDTMGTQLEEAPAVFGERVLGANGWELGPHA